MKKLISLMLTMVMLTCAAALAETYIIGTNPEFAPFEFVGDDGNITGIDVDIVDAIFAIVDPEAEIVWEAMDFNAVIPAMVSGKIDIGASGFSITDERKQSVDFSDPYYEAVQAVVVKADSAIVTEADLAGKKIGVQEGTTGDFYVTDYITDAEISRFNKGIDAVQDVLAGRLDAVVIDDAPATVFADSSEDLKLLDIRLNSGNEFYGIAFPKGSELVAKVNEALATLIADGTIDEIVTKYFSR